MTHQGDKHVEQQDVGEHNVPDEQQVQKICVPISGVVIGNKLVNKLRVNVAVLFRLLLLPNRGLWTQKWDPAAVSHVG